MGRTHRTNERLKRAHWHAARTERRGRFAHGWFWAEDEDLAYRRRGQTRRERGRAFGSREGVAWLTVDKSHVRFLLSSGRLSPARAAMLARRFNMDGAVAGGG